MSADVLVVLKVMSHKYHIISGNLTGCLQKHGFSGQQQKRHWCSKIVAFSVTNPHMDLTHKSLIMQEVFLCHGAISEWLTVYPKKYAHSFVVLCFVVVMQSFIMNSHEVFIHIHQGCFTGTGAIVRLPQCQWSKPDGYGKISQCITTTKHSKAVTVCIYLGIYCRSCPNTVVAKCDYNTYQGQWPQAFHWCLFLKVKLTIC